MRSSKEITELILARKAKKEEEKKEAIRKTLVSNMTPKERMEYVRVLKGRR